MHLRAGNKDAAGQFALRLQTVSAQLKENRAQLESAEKTYQELVRAREVSIHAAQDKIEALKFGLSDLKIKHATAELNEMAAGMIQKIGGSGDTLGRLSVMVEEDRQRAAGRCAGGAGFTRYQRLLDEGGRAKGARRPSIGGLRGEGRSWPSKPPRLWPTRHHPLPLPPRPWARKAHKAHPCLLPAKFLILLRCPLGLRK